MNGNLKITILIAAVFGILTGATIGLYEAGWNAGAVASERVIAASSAAFGFAAEQFHHADAEHARQAVMLQIDILKQFEHFAPSPIQERNLGFAYARLAIIDQAAGEKDAAQGALKEAKAWFRKVHPQEEISDAQMEKFMQDLESRIGSRSPSH